LIQQPAKGQHPRCGPKTLEATDKRQNISENGVRYKHSLTAGEMEDHPKAVDQLLEHSPLE